MNTIKKSKKGVSVMIGYVLLVFFVIAISTIIYQQLKSKIPEESTECPEGTSIMVEDYSCENSELTLNLKNNGRFNIGGYYIYASDNSESEVATIDLSKHVVREIKLNPGVGFSRGTGDEAINLFKPGETNTHTFNLEDIQNIAFIEIIPLRLQTENNKNRLIVCGNSKINIDIDCN